MGDATATITAVDLDPRYAVRPPYGPEYLVPDAPDAPVLTMTGTVGVITGVRYSWMDHCNYCRKAVMVFTDGGEIRVGIEATPTGKTPSRWFCRYETKAQPTAPAECPLCGAARGFSRYSYKTYPPLPTAAGSRLLSHVYDLIRRDHADDGYRADGVQQYADHRINGKKWS